MKRGRGLLSTVKRIGLPLRGSAFLAGLGFIVFVVAAVVLAPSAHAVDVTFADANLEAAVRSQLSPPIPAIQPITDTDMGTLVSLSADDLGITDLGGLEYATNLTALSLRANEITDISVVSGLGSLTTLSLGGNQITDISAVAGLGSLTELDLGINEISDVSAIQGLANLSYLDLYVNQIVDVTPLAGLTGLDFLYLDYNQIADITPLSSLSTLSELYLGNNQIVNVTPLAGLTNLEYLELENNQIVDVSVLASLPRLTWVQLGSNPLSDISALVLNSDFASGDQLLIRGTGLDMTAGSPARADVDTLVARGVYVDYDEPVIVGIPVVFDDPNLEAVVRTHLGIMEPVPVLTTDMTLLGSLFGGGMGITDLTGLEHAVNLTYLELTGNQVSDLGAVASLTNLQTLYLDANQLTDVSQLAGIPSLRFLSLQGNQISDVSPLATLTGLMQLQLTNNQIADITSLQSLTALTDLVLGGNQLSSIQPVSSMTGLVNLYLNGNRIEDISPLEGLTNLAYVPLEHNHLDVSAGSPAMTTIALLQSRGTVVTYAPQDTPPPATVTFADPALEAAVRTQLTPPILAPLPLTEADVLTLTTLNADELGIAALGGLEYATHLTSLSLRDNQIADLTSVASLGNLTTLALSGNQITELTPIAGLVNLTYLDLGFNQINDAAPVSGLINLNVLSLSENQISDISAIQGLTHLSELHLYNNQIADVSALAGLPQLGYVQLGRNPLEGISALVLNSDFASGDQLYIRDTGLDLTVGSPARADVESLVARGVYVDYDEPLVVEPVVFADANLESAVRARLSIPAGEPITENDMLALTYLNAGNAGIADLGGLEYATNLQQLDLSANQITSVAPLGTLTSLTTVSLGNNLIADITPLQDLTGLSALYLHDNQISSIAPLAALADLQTVELGGNNIDDISPLLANLGITGAGDTVGITHNYLDLAPDSPDVADILALQARGVSVSFDPQVSVGERAYIDDAALEQAIRSEVTISSIMPITLDDMLRLTHLSAVNRGIATLAGLQNATNLTSLDLSGNQLTGIGPLLFNPGLGAGDIVDLRGNKLDVTAGSAAMTDINTLVARGVQVEYIPQIMPFRVRFLSDPPKAASFLVNTTVPGNSVSGYTPAEGYSVTQYVDAGGSGQPVTADNHAYYRFVRWSDGVTSPTRQFTNVSADATVTAVFFNVHESQGDPGCFVAGCHDSDRAPNALDWNSVTPGFDLGPQYVAIHDWYAGPGSENPDSENSCYLCHNNPPVSPPESGTTCNAVCHEAVPHQGQAAGHAVTAASSQCTGCHGADIVDIHGADTDSTRCESCHDNPANWNQTADCNTGCHADKYDAGGNVVQHGDPTAAHAGAVTPECADCHGSDLTALHADCDTCHASGTPTGETCATCHSDIEPSGHGFPVYSKVYNPGYNGGSQSTGYLSWSYAEDQTGVSDSPHGNYSTSTNKCVVCHAVHRADPDGVVLTAWGGVGTATPAFSSTMAPFESCFFCHGNGATFTDKTVEFFVTSGGVLSPHTTCGRCHTASPHGAGTSDYAVLSSKLINDHADPQLDVDIRDSNNGLTADLFDLSDASKVDQGTTLATGYLCVGCHGSASNEHVFAVNERGATPALHYTANTPAPGDDAAPGNVTGHQVWIGASSTWNSDESAGTWYSGGGAHDYYQAVYVYDGARYKVRSDGAFDIVDENNVVTGGPVAPSAVPAWASEVAFNNAYGCGACHDAKRTNGKLAFPHGYVNDAGAPAPKWSNRTEGIFDNVAAPGIATLQTSFIWMTKADDADGVKELQYATGVGATQRVNIDANPDGMCLKCHLSGDKSEGVGETY